MVLEGHFLWNTQCVSFMQWHRTFIVECPACPFYAELLGISCGVPSLSRLCCAVGHFLWNAHCVTFMQCCRACLVESPLCPIYAELLGISCGMPSVSHLCSVVGHFLWNSQCVAFMQCWREFFCGMPSVTFILCCRAFLVECLLCLIYAELLGISCGILIVYHLSSAIGHFLWSAQCVAYMQCNRTFLVECPLCTI